MKKTDTAVLIEGLRRLSADAAQIADALEGKKEEAPAEEQPAAQETKTYTFEEVRGILADRSRAGYRAEVKALLTSRGVKQLSEITDPKELAALVAEAEVIGNA